jgi:Ca2+-binding RTX toxin-like protein
MGEWGDDTLFGDLDDDLVCGNEGRDVLLGNVGKDVLCGGLDDDTVYGGKDDDVLFGEAGDDVLAGDLGNDIAVGGAGRDRFVLREDGGHDVIVDFEVGVDLLALSGGLTPDAVEFVAGDRGAIVRLAGGDRLLATLENVSADELSARDLTLI